jgi:HPr kinase/phosphorylase
MNPRVTIDEFFRANRESLSLELIGGRRGLARSVEIPRIQKPGLALAGYLPQIHPDRIQVLGNTEVSYLATLQRARARKAVRTLLHAGVSCVIVTNAAKLPDYLPEEADRAGVALLSTRLRSALLIRGVTVWLERRLAPQTQLHGALLEVFYLGALILGQSGMSPRLLGHHVEIRGLGIADVASLYGLLATLEESRVDLVLELEESHVHDEIERLGLEEESYRILDIDLPLVRIPVRPGRSIAVLVEVAVRNQVLKRRGVYSAREFSSRLDAVLAAQAERAAKGPGRRNG